MFGGLRPPSPALFSPGGTTPRTPRLASACSMSFAHLPGP